MDQGRFVCKQTRQCKDPSRPAPNPSVKHIHTGHTTEPKNIVGRRRCEYTFGVEVRNHLAWPNKRADSPRLLLLSPVASFPRQVISQPAFGTGTPAHIHAHLPNRARKRFLHICVCLAQPNWLNPLFFLFPH